VPSHKGHLRRAPAGSKLGQLRVAAGYNQADMADLTGIALSVYSRLERNTRPGNVNYRALVNCAAVLGVDVDELIQDEWREWHVFDKRRPGPPDRG
jgi:transcriptional regulator with XRE-family HTH domain